MAILDEVMSEYKTDPKHVYLTGLSMGGSGTFSLAAAHPERWAAIAPICNCPPLISHIYELCAMLSGKNRLSSSSPQAVPWI